MFGELIGLWCVEVWRLMGAPASFHLVELGPGRGTLMSDALRAARIAPDFLAALDVHLVEISLPLRERQRAALEGRGFKVAWHASVSEIPPGPAIIIANEFFDALPVRHYLHRDGGWRERLVGLDEEGRLTFGLGAAHETAIAAQGEPDDILEVGVAALRLMTQLGVRIVTQGGALLAIDYGYSEPARGETLQAVRGHKFVDPLADPGEADLTAHVNFTALARAAKGAGAAVHGPVAARPVPDAPWHIRAGGDPRARRDAGAGRRHQQGARPPRRRRAGLRCRNRHGAAVQGHRGDAA